MVYSFLQLALRVTMTPTPLHLNLQTWLKTINNELKRGLVGQNNSPSKPFKILCLKNPLIEFFLFSKDKD